MQVGGLFAVLVKVLPMNVPLQFHSATACEEETHGSLDEVHVCRR